MSADPIDGWYIERPDYADLRKEARNQGVRVNELLALTPANDPFYVGLPSRTRDGQWFVDDVWQLLGQPIGAHLRRLHYQLVSQERPPLLPSGQPYENTESCWQYLNSASRNARYLGLIGPTALEDHRSPQPRLYATSRAVPEPAWAIDDLENDWGRPSLPKVDTGALDSGVHLWMPSPSVTGYDYDQADQPYHLEVWIEKSTMDDVLVPICQRFGVTLQTGVGYLSVSRVCEMLQRVASHGKPARLIYLSDFDPSGEGMPIQVARQSEFWLPELGPGADLKLTALLLTKEQVAHYQLPRSPIKDEHRQKNDFESRHGEGAVELDAMEALHPGVLARMVRAAIEPYIDRTLPQQLEQTSRDASRTLTEAWEAATEDERGELADIEDEAEVIVATYQEELGALATRLDAELLPLKERLDAVWRASEAKRDAIAFQLPPRPTSNREPLDSEEEWLFDASRDYDEQVAFYKQRRPGQTITRREIACEICGAMFTTNRSNVATCSPPCQAKRSSNRATAKRKVELAARQSVSIAERTRACPHCGTVFTGAQKNSRFCSSACQVKAWKVANPDKAKAAERRRPKRKRVDQPAREVVR